MLRLPLQSTFLIRVLHKYCPYVLVSHAKYCPYALSLKCIAKVIAMQPTTTTITRVLQKYCAYKVLVSRTMYSPYVLGLK
jgi:hypothetical protein